MESTEHMTRHNNWRNIIFFIVTTTIGLIGTPWYIIHYGITLPEILLFVFFTFASGMGITVGYHRLFSHSTYKAHPVIQFLLLFFASAASSWFRTHSLLIEPFSGSIVDYGLVNCRSNPRGSHVSC